MVEDGGVYSVNSSSRGVCLGIGLFFKDSRREWC